MKLAAIVLTLLILIIPSLAIAQAIVADHNAADAFGDIPLSYFTDIPAEYNFFYGHTSHGSQIMTGLHMLEDEDPTWEVPYFSEYGDDLGHNGDVSWVAPTVNYLEAHPECNVVVWSWCGGCSDNTDEGIDAYLTAMDGLESEYPDVVFIYMTGHLDWSGDDGLLYHNNNRIRDYCAANGKILFDFADIEAHDPDGNFYPDETDACGWCAVWCAEHPDDDACGCGSCAHSHCFNCYRKGRAFWWMMATIDGWNSTGVVQGDTPVPTGRVVLEQNHPNPFNPNTDISFTLREAGAAALTIHDLAGRTIRELYAGGLAEGRHTFTWNGRDADGNDMPSGVYLYRVTSGGGSATEKMTLLK